MSLSKSAVANMIDISAVQADSSREEVESIINAAILHGFIAVFTLPSFVGFAQSLLTNQPSILLGGTVGFPSGSSTTKSKVFEAEELLSIGCDELDMVINIGKLKSQMFDEVLKEIKAIVNIAGQIPIKVILEVSLLSEVEIEVGSKIIRDSGAGFIKTGTGWNGATTLDHIKIIRNAVGDSIPIKVAGGVRNLESLLAFHHVGVSRFGLRYKAAIGVMEEFFLKSMV